MHVTPSGGGVGFSLKKGSCHVVCAKPVRRQAHGHSASSLGGFQNQVMRQNAELSEKVADAAGLGLAPRLKSKFDAGFSWRGVANKC